MSVYERKTFFFFFLCLSVCQVLLPSVCWKGTEDVIADLETACLHTSSVYTSGSHSYVVSSLLEACRIVAPTAAMLTASLHIFNPAGFKPFPIVCFAIL